MSRLFRLCISMPFQSLKTLFYIADVRKHARRAARYDEQMKRKFGRFAHLIIWHINCERASRFEDIKKPLSAARSLGYRNILCAQNFRNDATVTESARAHGVFPYFYDIVVCKAVRLKDIYGIIKKHNADMRASYLFSDEENGEAIPLGNFFGLRTIALGDAVLRSPVSGYGAPMARLDNFEDIVGVLEKSAGAQLTTN